MPVDPAYVPPPLHLLTSETYATDQDGHFTVRRVFKHGVEVVTTLAALDSAKGSDKGSADLKLVYLSSRCC
jgi:hypothetical protein